MRNILYTDELFQYDLKNFNQVENQKTKEERKVMEITPEIQNGLNEFKELVQDIRWLSENEFHFKYANKDFNEVKKASRSINALMILMVKIYDMPK